MLYRAILMAAAMVGISPFAAAQTTQPVQAESGRTLKSPEVDPAILEVQWLAVNENFLERFGDPNWKKLPELGSYSLYTPQQIGQLFNGALGDRRSSVSPIMTVALREGEKRDLSPFGTNRKGLGKDAVQVTVSKDRQVFHVQLAWAQRKVPLPAMAVAMPVGKDLLIHTDNVVSTMVASPSSTPYGTRFSNDPDDRKAGSLGGRETKQVFLLLKRRLPAPEQSRD